MRGVVFGNSHAATLISAWRAAGEAAGTGLDLMFYVQPGGGPRGAEFADGQVRATTADLMAYLDRFGTPRDLVLGEVDFCVVVGCGLSLFAALRVLGQHTIFGWAEDASPPLNLISAAAARAAMRDALASTEAARLVAGLRGQGAGPVLVVPQPRPARRVLGSGLWPRLDALLVAGDTPRLSDLFETGLADLFAGDQAVRVLPQPPSSVVYRVTTRNKLARQAIRLFDMKSQFGQEDILHANARYGALVLSQIAASLGVELPAAQAPG